jgi:hypothetical protein
MNKTLGIDIPGSTTFTPGASGIGTVTFNGISLTLANIKLITNVTRNEIIYNFASAAKGAASFGLNTLTLDFDTSTHSGSDVLQVILDVTGAQDVSTGEMIETLSALRMAVQSLTRAMGRVDATGRLVVAAEQPTAASLNVALASLATVSTVTNQAQHGGIAANDLIPTLSRLGGDSLRRNISVT